MEREILHDVFNSISVAHGMIKSLERGNTDEKSQVKLNKALERLDRVTEQLKDLRTIFLAEGSEIELPLEEEKS